MTDLILSDDEIKALTRKHHRRLQSQALSALGIEHKRRADGSIVVLREHVTRVLCNEQAARQTKKTAPRFDLVT